VLRVDAHPQLGTIVHVRIDGMRIRIPQDPSRPVTMIEHMPFSESALLASTTRLVREGTEVPDYSAGYAQWLDALERGNGGIFTISVAEGIDVMERTLNP